MSKQSFNMTYSLGTNFDKELIPQIKEIDKENSIRSLFGKLRRDFVGGGRSSMILPNLTKRQLKLYIAECHRNNLKFNYLINPMCLENKDMMPSQHKKIIKFIGQLVDMGIDGITINSPLLCELIKKQFPDVSITIGLYAYIFKMQHIKYWDQLGADELTMHHMVNRNFKLLEQMLLYTKNTRLKLRLIANNVCLHDCPYQINHGTGLAHASQSGHASSNIYLDYNLLSCNYNKLKDPGKLLASEWIRPEDVSVYEELCRKTGNNNFSIKLLERTKTTDFLTRVVKAYVSRSYDGNLIDLVAWPSLRNTYKLHITGVALAAVMKRFDLSRLKKFLDVFNLPDVYVDNKKLNGFLSRFQQNYVCGNRVCSDSLASSASGMEDQELSCTYCRQWAEKVITYDEKKLKAWLTEVESVFEDLKTSKLFH